MTVTRGAMLALLLAGGLATPPLAAEGIAADAPPTLVVSGKIASGGGTRELTRAEIEAFGTVSIETRTPWYSGVVRFEGVPLRALLAELGATGERIVPVARDGYKGEIPVADLAKYGPILATKRNGEPLTRDRGPFWIVYPYDSAPELKSQTYYKRSIWQVVRLTVE